MAAAGLRVGGRPGSLLVLEACALAAAVRVGLRLVSLPRLAALLGRLPRTNQGNPEYAGTCLAAASAAAARVAHPTCLFRSLIAFGLLARRGRDVEIHVGASREYGFNAHAWLTLEGMRIDPLDPAHHAGMWSHPARARAR